MRVIEIRMEQRCNERIPEKICQPAASSGTILTCENPGVTRQGIEPGSPWWEASGLNAQPPVVVEAPLVQQRAVMSQATGADKKPSSLFVLPWSFRVQQTGTTLTSSRVHWARNSRPREHFRPFSKERRTGGRKQNDCSPCRRNANDSSLVPPVCGNGDEIAALCVYSTGFTKISFLEPSSEAQNFVIPKLACALYPVIFCTVLTTIEVETSELGDWRDSENWLDYSHPTKANRVQARPGHTRIFANENRAGTMPLVGGFSRRSPVSPAIAFRPILTSFHPLWAIKTSLRATQIFPTQLHVECTPREVKRCCEASLARELRLPGHVTRDSAREKWPPLVRILYGSTRVWGERQEWNKRVCLVTSRVDIAVSTPLRYPHTIVRGLSTCPCYWPGNAKQLTETGSSWCRTVWEPEVAHTRREVSGRPRRITSREDSFIVRQAVGTPRASMPTIQGHVTAAGEVDNIANIRLQTSCENIAGSIVALSLTTSIIATKCRALSAIAIKCRALSVIAIKCRALSAIATKCRALSVIAIKCRDLRTIASKCRALSTIAIRCRALSTIATKCRALSTIAIKCRALSVIAIKCRDLSVIATKCRALSTIATKCRALSAIATMCNALSVIATKCRALN
ncbi:hypothetical protein PR048_014489 [Dryococelus australis]|uniref:Uncharacterized protein n=1 Tax=Dryococelus australis TaxID=614101 RepID=A0ABQ9HED2_9NEOP|nr:hypothetical protein PR048_014489 [Dryococelus australis]